MTLLLLLRNSPAPLIPPDNTEGTDDVPTVIPPPPRLHTVAVCEPGFAFINEYDEYITPDHQRYSLNVPNARWVLSEEGTGMPEIEYRTQRGPYQDGVTAIGYRLQPRVVQLIIRHQYKSRPGYWNGRAALLDTLRPNRVVQSGVSIPRGTLRKYLANGEIRDLKVMILQGPTFAPRSIDAWDEHAYQEVIRFIAHDPVYYDPIQHELEFLASGSGGSSGGTSGFTFPVTFPLQFGAGGSGGGGGGGPTLTQTLAYAGNWNEFPELEIHGPILTPRFSNETTDENLQLLYDVPSGKYVHIVTAYGQKAITLEPDGINLLGYLSADSDLGTFHLQPGDNEISLFGTGTGTETRGVVKWFDRYVGI